jgi:predicted MFS family arabinose efflux permease
MMLIGLPVMLLGCSLLPLAELGPVDWQKGWFIGAFVLVFLGLALFFVNMPPFIMKITSSTDRSHVFSVQVALWALAGFAGSLIGGFLPRLISIALDLPMESAAAYRYPLFIAAALLIPAIIAVATAQPEEPLSLPATEPSTGLSLSAAWRMALGLIALMALIRFLQVTSMGATVTFFNLYLDTSLQVATFQIGILSALGRLLGVPAAMITPAISARHGPGYVVIWASLAGTLSMLPLALIPHWSAAGLGFMGVVALSSLRYPAFLVYSMELVSPELRGAMSGAGEMAAGFSFALMALTGGYLISQFGFSILFLTGAVLSGLGGLAFWLYFRRARQTQIYQAPETSSI